MLAATLIAGSIVAQAASWSASATVTQTRESLRYRFENPSSINSTELVPHFFEQTYDTRNLWLGARVTHPLGGRKAEARVAVTPQATRRADDFDTFFQPDGNVIVSGTTGTASIRSWRAEERVVLGRLRGAEIGLAASYRQDSARYHDGTGIVTTSMPPTETRRLVTTREFVTSRMIESSVFAAADTGGLSLAAGVVPAGSGWLTVDLPDKYPGRLLRFVSRYSAASAQVRYARRVLGARLGLGLEAQATRPWRSSDAVRLRSLGLLLDLTL